MKTLAYALGLTAVILISQGCTINNSPTTGSGPIGGGSSYNGPKVLSAFATIGSGSYFNSPAGLQYVGGNLWITNNNADNLQEWVTNGSAPSQTVSVFNTSSTFNNPSAAAVDPISGDLYVADSGNNQVVVFDSFGNYLASLTTGLSGSAPAGVAVNSAGTTLYVAGQNTSNVYVFSILSAASYSPVTAFGSTGGSGTTLNTPANLALDSSGNLWVADQGNHRLAEYSVGNAFSKSATFSSGFSPSGITLDSSGALYAADTNSHSIIEFTAAGAAATQVGALNLNNPSAVTTDDNGIFYVADQGNNQIVAFR